MTLQDYEIYAGVAGFPDDDPSLFIGMRYSYNVARADALAMLSNPYTWVRVVASDSGVIKLDIMAEHRARIH